MSIFIICILPLHKGHFSIAFAMPKSCLEHLNEIPGIFDVAATKFDADASPPQ